MIKLEGHIKYEDGRTLCGKSPEAAVQKLKLYGDLCPDCSEIATLILRGKKIQKKRCNRK